MISFIFGQSGWCCSSGSISLAGLNSAPYVNAVFCGSCVALFMLKLCDSSSLVLYVAASCDLSNFHGDGWSGSRGWARMCLIIFGRFEGVVEIMGTMVWIVFVIGLHTCFVGDLPNCDDCGGLGWVLF